VSRHVVKTKEDFMNLLETLLKQDANAWANETTSSYLEAMVAWLSSADGFYKNIGENTVLEEPTWQLFADRVQAVLI
jgi:hypothetical protein